MKRGIVLLALAGLCSGCAELTMFSFAGRHKLVESSTRNPVVELICLWEPGEGQGLDGLPTRGFVGQLLFITAGNPQPAKVHGDVRIYVFDDQGPPEEQAKPLHQFDFAADAWNTYLREANIGASYQLFIPYTRKTAQQVNCSLRVRYTPSAGGSPVYSKMASVVLPGRTRSADRKTAMPEGNSVPSPEGAPARTESASSLTLSLGGNSQLQEKLERLKSIAAATQVAESNPTSSPAHIATPAHFTLPAEAAGRPAIQQAGGLTGELERADAVDEDEDLPVSTYRLAPAG